GISRLTQPARMTSRRTSAASADRFGQCLRSQIDGGIDIHFFVFGRKETRLEGRGCKEDAAAEAAVEVAAEEINVGSASIRVVPDRTGGEEDSPHGSDRPAAGGNAEAFCCSENSGHQPPATHLERRMWPRLLDQLQLSDASRHRNRISGQGPRLVDWSIRSDLRHDRRLPAVGTYRQPP